MELPPAEQKRLRKQAQSAIYRANHREELRQKARDYYTANRDRILEKSAATPSTEKKRQYWRDRWQSIKAARPQKPDPIDTINDVDIAYMAGLLDGEGCINFSYSSTRKLIQPSIQIIMTAGELIAWVASLWDVSITMRDPRQKHPNHKPQYGIRLAGKRAIRLAERLLPYLRLKHEQAQLLIEFADTYRDYGTDWCQPLTSEVMMARENLRIRMKALNQDGKKHPPTSLLRAGTSRE